MKVYHADEKTHQQVHRWCRSHDLEVKAWVDAVVKDALDRKVVDPSIRELPVPKKPAEPKIQQENPVPVSSVPLDYDPWTKPPFWVTKRVDKPRKIS